MKSKKVVYKIISLMMLIIVCGSSVCYASVLGSPSSFKPDSPVMGSASGIVSKISGALTVVGIILIVVFGVIMGFNIILGSASEKAIAKEKFGGLFIAAAILTGGSILTTLIIRIAESFGI